LTAAEFAYWVLQNLLNIFGLENISKVDVSVLFYFLFILWLKLWHLQVNEQLPKKLGLFFLAV